MCWVENKKPLSEGDGDWKRWKWDRDIETFTYLQKFPSILKIFTDILKSESEISKNLDQEKRSKVYEKSPPKIIKSAPQTFKIVIEKKVAQSQKVSHDHKKLQRYFEKSPF